MKSQSGMTLIEVMVTVLVICTGTLATLGTYVHFSSASTLARERTVLNSVAQREIERLSPLGFKQLGLTASPPSAAATEAPRTGKAAGEALVVNGGSNTSGVVLPGGQEFTYDGVRMRVYRYVTYRQPTCTGLTDKIRQQLATRFGLTLSALNAAISNACSVGLSSTKRVTVAAVPVDGGGATDRAVVLSTIRRDPESLPVLDIPTSALSVAPVTNVLTGGGTSPVAAQTETSTVTMLDTRCSKTSRYATVDHETRDTAQQGWTCSESGPAPKLMTLAGVPGTAADPVRDFSNDVTRAAVGGLAMLRDTAAGTCTANTNLVYQNGEAAARMHSIHKWATTAPTAPIVVPAGGGRASLTLYTSTADGTTGPGRLCVTLQTMTGVVLGSSDFKIGSWPGKVTELTTAFDIAGGTIAAGTQLVLTLRVPSDSGEDLRILYDHPAYASTLSFTSEAGKGFR